MEAVSVVEATRRLADQDDHRGWWLVDVREPDEFAQFRAEGAILLPLSTFQLRYRELPTDRPLLIICATGTRSRAAGEFLTAQGYGTVANVEGGTVGWAQARLPLRVGRLADGEGDLPPRP